MHSVYDRINLMRESYPIIWWKAVCYHYVRRTRQVTRYRNGDAFTTTQVYYERVNSHTSGSAFNFIGCGVKDVSRNLSGLEDYPATKIKFSKGFSFATVEGESEFEDQRAQFFQDNEERDDYMETREGMDLLNINFKDYVIAFADPHNLPWYVSHVVFWGASFLLLSWPLRVVIEFKTAYVHYHVHKLFGINYTDTSSYPGTMSRANTMGSSELEMNIRNNYTLVPSYSEALLMETATRYRTADANGNITPGTGTPRSITFTSLLTPTRSNSYIHGMFATGYISTSHTQNSMIVLSNGHIPSSQALSIENCAIEHEVDSNISPDQRRHNRNRRRKRNRQSRRLEFSDSVDNPNSSAQVPSTPDTPDESNNPMQNEAGLANGCIKRTTKPPARLGAIESEMVPCACVSNHIDGKTAGANGQPGSDEHVNVNRSCSGDVSALNNTSEEEGPPTTAQNPTSEEEGPPTYEDALWMQRILPTVHMPVISPSEGENLLAYTHGQRSYRTIQCMETSL